MPVPPIRTEHDHAVPDEGVARFIRNYVDRYDAESQTLTSTYFYEIHHVDGRQDRFIKDLSWHMYFPHELRLLLRLAGLDVVERWGGYDQAPFGSRSRQYLWVTAAT